ncbi:MAG: hypothetical protein R3Y32_06490 [Bacillota bacterium]
MLKTGCVFDLEKIENFYQSCGEDAGISNTSMFFQMSEDDVFYGMIKMDMNGEDCILQDAVVKTSNLQYEEFLLKSCINFALTFNAKRIVTSVKYQQFLIPMHFFADGENLAGSTAEIDFPHTCQCGNA